MKRRNFLKGMAAAPLLASGEAFPVQKGVLVNDVHTGLNPTWVASISRPTSVAEVQSLVKDCGKHSRLISVSGSRHATGGQQFATQSVLLDMRAMNRVIGLDDKTGVLHVEAGIEWPELIQGYLSLQKENVSWGIRQKQGGADRMSLGGTLSANAHGHSLGSPPIIGDVEWIQVVTADGSVKKCSRRENAEFFSLVAGGYGLFGIITAVGLRLVPRRRVRRHVETRTTAELIALIEGRTAAGAPYGYFQYSIDETSADFLRAGVLTTYEDVSPETPLGKESTDIDTKLLTALLEIAHRDRGSAYRRYAKLELSKDGNVEWSDLHQLSTYPAGYHQEIEKRLGADYVGADLILEVYVPRAELIPLLEDARRILLASGMPLIYGTVRFIEQDKDSYLAWAKKRYVCVIFSPHSSGETQALRKTGEVCRQLIRAANKRGGSFYLTYNRFATRDELATAYPQFQDFLNLKKQYDPREIFQSDWYRYYKGLYA
ncbi:MAG TPA: FAD-binding oxidoreductase [Candidatus Binatus sp.]|nr:FAD-binding oxidoreductase [Candidatus Binatus sp.]